MARPEQTPNQLGAARIIAKKRRRVILDPMPALSLRAHECPASPIRRLVPFADAAKKRGISIYHLNIGQPDVKSPDTFWKAIRNSELEVLEYSHSEGVPALREALAAQYRSSGIDVQTEHVMVTTAGSEALIFAMLCALNPGDEVIVPEPMYANYIGFGSVAGVRVIPVETHIEHGFAMPTVEHFAERISPRTRAILICNPNNPTGAIYSDQQLEDLRDLALRHDLFVIGDEVYREFNYTGRPIRSVLQLEGLDRHAIMIDSASKRYSLCGARVGFLVSRNREFMAAALKFAQARLSSPTLEQYGVLAALETPASYFHEVRAEYQARRDLLVGRLRAMPGVLCPDIDGAFYATVRLPIDDSDEFCRWMLESFSSDGETVMMAPATGFYASPGKGADEVRIAYVLEKHKLDRAMDLLALALSQYPGRTS